MRNVDANIVLYSTDSKSEFYDRALDALRDSVMFREEVLCEVVYVLSSQRLNLERSLGGDVSEDRVRYSVYRSVEQFLNAFPKVECDRHLYLYALHEFAFTGLDMVDSLLVARAVLHSEDVVTNDYELTSMLVSILTHSGKIPLKSNWSLSSVNLPDDVKAGTGNKPKPKGFNKMHLS